MLNFNLNKCITDSGIPFIVYLKKLLLLMGETAFILTGMQKFYFEQQNKI